MNRIVIALMVATALHLEQQWLPVRVTLGGGTNTLLTSSSFVDLGGFKTPALSDLAYSAMRGMGFDAAGNGAAGSIYTNAFGNAQIAEISLATPSLSTNQGTWNTATRLQNTVNIQASFCNDVEQINDDTRLGGVFVVGSQLMLTCYVEYSGALIADGSHFLTSSKTIASMTKSAGPANAVSTRYSTNLSPGFAAGPIVEIPAQWRASFGGHTHASGLWSAPITSRTSQGPSMRVFTASDLVGKTTGQGITGVDVVGYPLGHPTLGGLYSGQCSSLYKGTNDIDGWSCASSRGGIIWPTYGRTVVFVSRHGDLDQYCYGLGVTSGDRDGPIPGVDTFWGQVSGASTSLGGTRVTVPNLNVSSITTDGRSAVYLSGETVPANKAYISAETGNQDNGQRYDGAAPIIGKGNSGTPSAYVDVSASNPFNDGLTGKTANVGELTCWDPAETSKGQHAPALTTPNYPLRFYLYDINDLISVYEGTLEKWEVYPYEMFTIDFTGITRNVSATYGLPGAALNPTTVNTVYLGLNMTETANPERATVRTLQITNPDAPKPEPLLPIAAGLAVWSVGGLLRRRRV